MSGKRLNRRTFLKSSLLGLGSLAALAGGSGLYGIFAERFWIQIRRLQFSFRRLPASLSGIRIVQFSDTHIGKYYSYERMEHVINLVARQQPDLICFTGDLFDSEYGEVSDEIIPLLLRLKARLGKYAVLGNHDMRLGHERVRSVLERSGFIVLVNDNWKIEQGNERIWIAGLDEMLYGKPDFNPTLRGVDPHDFLLMLAHEPDLADKSLTHQVDFQLSGHSHGGQIRIPFYGSFFTPDGAKKYPIGLYAFEGTEFKVYTNRGIGTTMLPIRFNCRPEITVFTLVSDGL